MSDKARTEKVLARLAGTRERREGLYRHLHAHPELSHEEHETAALVAERLRTSGFEVHQGIGGTGVVGILRNGDGPRVLLRADMDALPVREATGLDYASTVTATDADGERVPVAHACGHDVHVTCLLEAADLLAGAKGAWSGTLVALFQPGEEHGDGAQAMVDAGVADVVGPVDVAMGQHLLAAMIVVRLQTVVSREIGPTEPAVVTVGSIHAGRKSNVIGESAVLELNIRTYSEETRARVLAAIERIVRAECAASASPREPQIERFDPFPVTVNDPATTATVQAAFDVHFGEDALDLPLQSASEDFSDIPGALGVPYTYWGIGGIDAQEYARAEEAGRVDQEIPANHSPGFAPVIQPTLDTGTRAMVVAALGHLA